MVRLTFTLLALASAAGCTTTTTVVRHDGTVTTGQAADADPIAVRLRTGWATVEVPRLLVRRIRHPGRRHRIAGITLLGLSATSMALAIPYLTAAAQGDGGDYCPACSAAMGLSIGAVSLAVGLGLTLWGGRTMRRSQEALEAPSPSCWPGDACTPGVPTAYRLSSP